MKVGKEGKKRSTKKENAEYLTMGETWRSYHYNNYRERIRKLQRLEETVKEAKIQRGYFCRVDKKLNHGHTIQPTFPSNLHFHLNLFH